MADNSSRQPVQNTTIAQVAKDIQEGKNEFIDLVFNPVTGEFEQRPRGTAGDGDVVVDMAKTGFA